MADRLKPGGHPVPRVEAAGRYEKALSILSRAVLLVLCLLWRGGGGPCWAEEKSKDKLLFLVARPTILDPMFERSVVLMVPLKREPLIVGLIINKPTRLPLLKIFPESPALKDRSENAYLGGPVDMDVPSLIFHAPKPPKQAILLYEDVYLSFDSQVISELLQGPKQSGNLRLFLGRSQWAPEQLQGEALRGSWYSLRAEGDVVFDRDSEHQWDRLHERARPPSSVENRLPQPLNGQPRTVAPPPPPITARNAAPASRGPVRVSVRRSSFVRRAGQT